MTVACRWWWWWGGGGGGGGGGELGPKVWCTFNICEAETVTQLPNLEPSCARQYVYVCVCVFNTPTLIIFLPHSFAA